MSDRKIEHNRSRTCAYCGVRSEIGGVPCCNPRYLKLNPGWGSHRDKRRVNPHHGVAPRRRGKRGSRLREYNRSAHTSRKLQEVV